VSLITILSSFRYGFVTFSNADAVKKALEAPEDELYLDHRYELWE